MSKELPTKEKVLYLPIKRRFFDAILSGEKKTEYREIKDTTALKYLKSWREGRERGLYYYPEKCDHDPGGDICVWNGGVYPYMEEKYTRIHFAVGYAKNRDEAIVEVKNITFEPLKLENGDDARFDRAGDTYIFNKDGSFCFWQVVYHLGDIIEVNRAKR